MEFNSFVDLFWFPSVVAFGMLVVFVKAKQFKAGLAL